MWGIIGYGDFGVIVYLSFRYLTQGQAQKDADYLNRQRHGLRYIAVPRPYLMKKLS